MEEYVEVGLGNAPTLANLGAKTLHLPEFAGNDTVVYNVGRDEGRVYMTDTDSLVPDDESEEAAASAPVETASCRWFRRCQARRGCRSGKCRD